MTINEELTNLKLYKESGIDEFYNDSPYVFFENNSFAFPVAKTPTPQQPTEKNISILKASEEAKKALQNISTIDALQQSILDFKLNPLSKFATHPITGIGVKNPSLLVITESPNSDEDRTGISLSGPTGELLKKILLAINSSVETNTFTFPASPLRAPGNRTPTEEEMEISKPFTLKFIEILKPKIILTMGSIPADILLNTKEPITTLRGKWFKYENIDVMPTFSLNYLLNNIEAKKKTWEDLKLLREKL